MRQYIGARYVPKFYENSTGTSEWQAGVAYEPLTVVTYNGNSFTSKKAVPSNIGEPNLNTEYWVSTGIYNAQIEAYRQEVADIREAIGDLPNYDTRLTDCENEITEVSEAVNGLTDDGYVSLSSYLDEYNGDFDRAFSAAMADVPVHGTIYIPYGEYTSNETITINKPIKVVGNFNGSVNGWYDANVTREEYFKFLITSNADPCVEILSPGVQMRDISIKSNKGTSDASSESIVKITPAANSAFNVQFGIKMYNVVLYGSYIYPAETGTVSYTQYGIYAPIDLFESEFDHCEVRFCQYGAHIGSAGTNSTSLAFQNCYMADNTEAGIYLLNTWYSTLNACAVDALWGKYGYFLEACRNVTFMGCGAEAQKVNNFRLKNSSYCTINGSSIGYGSGSGTPASDCAGIYLDGACSSIKFIGCMVDSSVTQNVNKPAVYFNNSGTSISIENCAFDGFKNYNNQFCPLLRGTFYRKSATDYTVTANDSGATIDSVITYTVGPVKQLLLRFIARVAKPTFTIAPYEYGVFYGVLSNGAIALMQNGRIMVQNDLTVGSVYAMTITFTGA